MTKACGCGCEELATVATATALSGRVVAKVIREELEAARALVAVMAEEVRVLRGERDRARDLCVRSAYFQTVVGDARVAL